MHLIITSLVFAIALFCTAWHGLRLIAAIVEHPKRSVTQPSRIVTALVWGLFYYLTHS